jgi:hypothetical protein
LRDRVRRQAVAVLQQKLDASNAASSIANPTNQRKQQVEFQSLQKSPFPADRIQKQQQCGTYQPLRRDRRTLGRNALRRKRPVELLQSTAASQEAGGAGLFLWTREHLSGFERGN